jgi:fimbrial chaperone protein
MMKNKRLGLFGIFSLITINLFSFQFEPISADFSSSGEKSIQTYQVSNSSAEIIAVRITMYTREMDEHGDEVNDPIDDLFLVYPNQIVLRPGDFQKVRVQWKGPAEIDQEANYRILAEQMPINFRESTVSGGSINILFKYSGVVYILPKNPKPDIILESVIRSTDQDGYEGLLLTFHNIGNAHSLLYNLSLRIFIGNNESTLPDLSFTSEQLVGINRQNILSGKRRVFFLPIRNLGDGDIRAEISYTPIR